MFATIIAAVKPIVIAGGILTATDTSGTAWNVNCAQIPAYTFQSSTGNTYVGLPGDTALFFSGDERKEITRCIRDAR